MLQGLVLAVLSAGHIAYAAPTALPPKSFYGQYARHFVASIGWPAAVGFSEERNFHFCILGNASEISPPPPSKWNFGAPVRITDVTDKNILAAADFCNAIFIASNEEPRLNEIFSAIRNKPILTISPIENFSGRGGMFGLVQIGDSIRFTINRSAVEAAGLRVSDPRVLDLAVSAGDG
jgi:hypothetical protein